MYLLYYMYDMKRGDDTVGDPHRARTSQFEFIELVLLSKVDKQFPVEQFEAIVSKSSVIYQQIYVLARAVNRGNTAASVSCMFIDICFVDKLRSFGFPNGFDGFRWILMNNQ